MKKIVRNALIVYVFTWLFVFCWILIQGSANSSISESFNFFKEAFFHRQFQFFVHGIFLVFFLVFLLILYFYRLLKKGGFKIMLKQLAIRLIAPVAILVFGINYILKNNTSEAYTYNWDYKVENKTKLSNELYTSDNKHRGMSVFGWQAASEDDITKLVKNNIEWVAVIPFLYQKNERSEKMSFNRSSDTWSRRDSSFIKNIRRLQDRNIRVMLKPHLWVSDGWRANLNLDNEEQWQQWFDQYEQAMLHYAKLAAKTNVELLCIGTELKTVIKQQPDRWKLLIKNIKNNYAGKLTYAANWHDEYEYVTFWSDLDYIGIQGYFPLTENKNPTLEMIENGWKVHKEQLLALSEKYGKPILFTEIGYRSDAATTIKPWEWNSLENMFTNERSTKAQQLAYEAFFRQFWNEPWFVGSYLWQWDFRNTEKRASESFDFSPQYKPAQNIMAKWYGNIVIDSLQFKN